jgi:uncharacterized protein YaaR (DUF327 family)
VVKVDPLRGGARALPGAKRKGVRGKGEPPAEPQRNAEGIPAHVMPMVEEVVAAGLALTNDPTGEHLDRYRLAVREFLDTALQDSMRVESEASPGLRQKVFSTVTRVDIALADLADALLGKQQDILRLKSIIDQIKGLVIDLYQ